MQKKCIHFCLKLYKMHGISEEEFKSTNWLPTSKRVDQCINTTTYNIVSNTCPYYLNEIFEFAPHCSIGTRNNFSKRKNSFYKTNMGQKTISYFGPSTWNSLLERANSLNTFKHNVKKHYLTWVTNNVFMWICVSLFIYMFKCPWVCIYTYALYQCIFLWLVHSQVVVLFFLFVCFIFCFPSLPLSLIFILSWGTTMKIRWFCPFCAIPANDDAIQICLQ